VEVALATNDEDELLQLYRQPVTGNKPPGDTPGDYRLEKILGGNPPWVG